MPRLKSTVTGVVVTVGDDVAAVLDSEWVSADATERSEVPDKSWKVADLKSFATEHDPVIDLGDATKKEEILAAITAALEPTGSRDAGSGTDSSEQ